MATPTDKNEASPSEALSIAVRKIRAGYLSQRERDALATLLQVTGSFPAVPSPIAAATFNALTAFTKAG